MVANNYLDESRPHKEVIEMMVLGFTGKLQQWWNNCLTEASKEDIKYAIQQDEEGNPIINEIEQGIPDGVNTLIYTIMKHFIGKPSNITARIYEQLSNLRCKTLGEYKWYEDVFTTRVMHRRDCNSPFWYTVLPLYPDCSKEFLTGKKPIREPLLYCQLCNNFVRDHGP